MIPDLVRALAFDACVDADALPVLGDAVLEALSTGWYDRHVAWLLAPGIRATRERKRVIRICAENMRPELPRAVLAVALFGEWSTARWALIAQHEARATEHVFGLLRELYPQPEVRELAYASSPLFRMIRRRS